MIGSVVAAPSPRPGGLPELVVGLVGDASAPDHHPTARKVCDALRPLVESAREADMLGRDIEAFFACCVRAMVWHRKDDPA